MALRLFQITDTSTGKPLKDEYYTNKQQAKECRRELNKEHESETRFIVSPGPDHRNYKG